MTKKMLDLCHLTILVGLCAQPTFFLQLLMEKFKIYNPDITEDCCGRCRRAVTRAY